MKNFEYSQYRNNYSGKELLKKLALIAKKAGKTLLYQSAILYYAMRDKNCPTKAKTIIAGALGYLILPVDVIPDVLPVAGLTDDSAAIATALAAIMNHINETHQEKARRLLGGLF